MWAVAIFMTLSAIAVGIPGTLRNNASESYDDLRANVSAESLLIYREGASNWATANPGATSTLTAAQVTANLPGWYVAPSTNTWSARVIVYGTGRMVVAYGAIAGAADVIGIETKYSQMCGVVNSGVLTPFYTGASGGLSGVNTLTFVPNGNIACIGIQP